MLTVQRTQYTLFSFPLSSQHVCIIQGIFPNNISIKYKINLMLFKYSSYCNLISFPLSFSCIQKKKHLRWNVLYTLFLFTFLKLYFFVCSFSFACYLFIRQHFVLSLYQLNVSRIANEERCQALNEVKNENCIQVCMRKYVDRLQ